MNYSFYYPEWNSRKDVCKEHPQIREITKQPIAFWYGVGPKRTIRKTKHSIQRLLKILGIFLRLYRRDKKKKYLKYLTRTWKLVELRLNHKKLKDLKQLFNKYFTKDIRKKKWI